jgi:hypothetical protein
MLGVVLAIAIFVVAFLAHVGFSHLVDVEKKERSLVAFMLGASLVYVCVFIGFRAADLGGLGGVPLMTDFVAGLLTLGFLVLGYVEFWSLVERSFSLRILIDAATSSFGLTYEQIAKSYSEGRGLDWMMDKRVEDLVGSGMLAAVEGRHYLTARGRVVGRVFRRLRRVFGIA